MPEKTNEITAIPELLDHSVEANQLEGALVTIHAMDCQVARRTMAMFLGAVTAAVAREIVLELDVEQPVHDAPAEELVVKDAEIEKAHGRIEMRTYTASFNVDWISPPGVIPPSRHCTNIKTLVKVFSCVEYADRYGVEVIGHLGFERWLVALEGEQVISLVLNDLIGSLRARSQTNPSAAPKHAESQQVGTRLTCSNCCSSNER